MKLNPQEYAFDKPAFANETSQSFSALSLPEFRTIFNTIGPDPKCLPPFQLNESDGKQDQNMFSKDNPFVTIGPTDVPKPQKDFRDIGRFDREDGECEREKLPGERITEWMRLHHYPRPNPCRSIDQEDTSRIFRLLDEKLNRTRSLPNPQLRW